MVIYNDSVIIVWLTSRTDIIRDDVYITRGENVFDYLSIRFRNLENLVSFLENTRNDDIAVCVVHVRRSYDGVIVLPNGRALNRCAVTTHESVPKRT